MTNAGSDDKLDAEAPWWHSASKTEIQRAPKTAGDFLRASGPADAAAVEAFARALALLWIFQSPYSPDNALREAVDAMPSFPAVGCSPEALAAAQAWLPRGNAIEAGIVAAMRLLRQPADELLSVQAGKFRIALSLLHDGCLTADTHAGLQAPIRARLKRMIL